MNNTHWLYPGKGDLRFSFPGNKLLVCDTKTYLGPSSRDYPKVGIVYDTSTRKLAYVTEYGADSEGLADYAKRLFRAFYEAGCTTAQLEMVKDGLEKYQRKQAKDLRIRRKASAGWAE